MLIVLFGVFAFNAANPCTASPAPAVSNGTITCSGNSVPSGQACVVACKQGYLPSAANVTCSAGEFSNATCTGGRMAIFQHDHVGSSASPCCSPNNEMLGAWVIATCTTWKSIHASCPCPLNLFKDSVARALLFSLFRVCDVAAAGPCAASPAPSLPKGTITCDGDTVPSGEACSVACEAGYIASAASVTCNAGKFDTASCTGASLVQHGV